MIVISIFNKDGSLKGGASGHALLSDLNLALADFRAKAESREEVVADQLRQLQAEQSALTQVKVQTDAVQAAAAV